MNPPQRKESVSGVASVGVSHIGRPGLGTDSGAPAADTRTDDHAGLVPLWVPVVGVLVTVAISLDVSLHGPLTRIDTQLSEQMLRWGLRFKPGPRRMLTPGLWFGQRGTMVTGSLLLAVWAARRCRTVEPVLRLIVAVIGLAVAVYAFKLGLARSAPIAVARGQRVATGASFPSGHTANAVVLWGLAQYTAGRARAHDRLFRAVRVGRLIAPAVVGVVMVLLDYHWLTDLLAGIAIGMVLLWVTLDPCWIRASQRIDSRIVH